MNKKLFQIERINNIKINLKIKIIFLLNNQNKNNEKYNILFKI